MKNWQKAPVLPARPSIQGDLSVFIPESTLIQEQKILVEGQDTEIEFRPSVKKYYVELQPPSLTDPSPDLTRLLWGIQKSGGPVAEKIYVPLEVMREIPALLRHSDWKVTGTIALVPGRIPPYRPAGKRYFKKDLWCSSGSRVYDRCRLSLGSCHR